MEQHPEYLVHFLRQSSHLSGESARQVAAMFENKQINAGDFLLRQGRPSEEYLLLASGFIRAWVSDIEGNDITTNLYIPGDVVFEVAGFFQRIPAQENLQAITDSAGWVLRFDALNKLFHDLPEFREFGRAMLVKNFISFKLRTLSLINQTADQRYAELLKIKPELLQHVPLKYVASYLGVTDTSLSRIRKQQQKK